MPVLTRDQVAKRAARELRDGMYVNLGIGMPTLVANFVPAGTDIVLQSENGLLGIGPFPYEGEEDPDLINAGKQTVTAVAGRRLFLVGGVLRHDPRRPHRLRDPGRDAGGGDRRSRQLDDPRQDDQGDGRRDGPGGGRQAGDRDDGARRQGKGRAGAPPPVEEKKILKRCTLPLTAVGAVHRIITDLAVLDVTPAGPRAARAGARASPSRRSSPRPSRRLIVEGNVPEIDVA